MKRFLFVLLTLVLSGVIAKAAPLTDFSFGSGNLQLAFTMPHIQATDESGTNVPSAAYGLDNGGELAFSLGLGKNFALHYAQGASFAPMDGRGGNGNYYYDKNSFDIMYGLKSDVYPLFVAVYFGGLNYEFGIHNDPDNKGVTSSYSELGYHLGIQGNYQFMDSVGGHLQVAWGSLDTEAEIGLAYNINKNLDFDLAVEYNALHGNDKFVQQYNENLFKIRAFIPKAGITLKF